MSLHITDDVRTAIVGNTSITALVGTTNSNPSVFTTRPTAPTAAYPMIVITPVDVNDMDGLTDGRPIVDVDVAVYGRKKDHIRAVESLGLLIRDLFHRQRFSISPSGVSVVQIVCRGPLSAPTDDESLIARLVSLKVTLKE